MKDYAQFLTLIGSIPSAFDELYKVNIRHAAYVIIIMRANVLKIRHQNWILTTTNLRIGCCALKAKFPP